MAVKVNDVTMTTIKYNDTAMSKVVIDGTTVFTGSGTATVTYYVDTNESYVETFGVGESVLSPTTFTPTKSGYTFMGWREDKQANSTVLKEKNMGSESIVLYAVFSELVYIQYNGNGSDGGSVPGAYVPIYCNNGNRKGVYELKENGYTKSGYKFVAWAKGSASGTQYKAGSLLEISYSTTFYAVWTLASVTVFSATFNENASNLELTVASKTMDSDYIKSVVTPKEITAESGKTNTTSGVIVVLQDKTKTDYENITITYKSLQYCPYGTVTAKTCGSQLYNVSDSDARIVTYTQKVSTGNTNWGWEITAQNDSSYYGCNNKLAVAKIELS